MTEASQTSQPLQWKLFIRRRASATQGTPPGKDELKWVANTTTLIHGEQDALLVDTFLSEAQTGELADWIAASGKRRSTIYITHAHPDHFFGHRRAGCRSARTSVPAPEEAFALGGTGRKPSPLVCCPTQTQPLSSGAN